ncbi:hypothetical protein [Actinoallomurus sp. CA-142502]|uniref:hypothetical protein n=1 Tax=Actinoallomurus sp. CA-142502 TaxID=3239885 RepID=UPI003D936C38
MGISVQIRTFTGAVEATCTHPAIDGLCERARHLDLPMLGGVDPHDDTVFNRSQMRLVIPELHRLAEETSDGEAQAAQEIIELTGRIEREPHRYLLFNGD